MLDSSSNRRKHLGCVQTVELENSINCLISHLSSLFKENCNKSKTDVHGLVTKSKTDEHRTVTKSKTDAHRPVTNKVEQMYIEL